MKNLFKQLLLVVFIISYIILAIAYARVDAQFKMYKTFTEKGIKVQPQVPCTLPPLT